MRWSRELVSRESDGDVGARGARGAGDGGGDGLPLVLSRPLLQGQCSRGRMVTAGNVRRLSNEDSTGCS